MKATGGAKLLPEKLYWQGDSWTVILLDDEAAGSIASGRGWNSDISDENHVIYIEGTEAEISFTFRTLEEAILFAESNYSCTPPNWPVVQNEAGKRGSYDGAQWHWDTK